MQRLACLTINLQGLPLLCRQLGVDERTLPPAAAMAVTRRAPERFAELFDRKGAPATFFVVGDDLEDGPSAMAVGELARLGHELASHGASGDPDLADRPAATIQDELRRARRAIETLQGRGPAGFRSLGHTTSPRLLEALEAEGMIYDASIQPSPLAWMRRSLGEGLAPAGAAAARAARAPTSPWRPHPDDPLRRGSARLIELPTSTVPLLRLPLSASLLAGVSRRASAAIHRAVRNRSFLSVELQGVDLLDGSDGIVSALRARRRDLRLSAAAKRQRISEWVDWLRNDFEVVTLEEAARRIAPHLP